jgi:hypothetical protein
VVTLVRAEVNDLPLAHLAEVGALVLNGWGVAFPHGGGSAQDEDAIIDLPDVLNVEVEGRPCLKGICKCTSCALVTSIAPSLQDVSGQQQFDVRMEAVDPRLRILCFERPKRGPHDLHVLLRHRPRSIPQAQESA